MMTFVKRIVMYILIWIFEHIRHRKFKDDIERVRLSDLKEYKDSSFAKGVYEADMSVRIDNVPKGNINLSVTPIATDAEESEAKTQYLLTYILPSGRGLTYKKKVIPHLVGTTKPTHLFYEVQKRWIFRVYMENMHPFKWFIEKRFHDYIFNEWKIQYATDAYIDLLREKQNDKCAYCNCTFQPGLLDPHMINLTDSDKPTILLLCDNCERVFKKNRKQDTQQIRKLLSRVNWGILFGLLIGIIGLIVAIDGNDSRNFWEALSNALDYFKVN